MIDELPIEEILKKFIISMNGKPIEEILSQPHEDIHHIGGWGERYVFDVSNQKLADRFTSFQEMEDICGSSFEGCETVGDNKISFDYAEAEACNFRNSKIKLEGEASSLIGCNFENATIDDSCCDSFYFNGSNLRNIKARDCVFISCHFDGCETEGADFTGSEFKHCDITQLNLSPEMLSKIKIIDPIIGKEI